MSSNALFAGKQNADAASTRCERIITNVLGELIWLLVFANRNSLDCRRCS